MNKANRVTRALPCIPLTAIVLASLERQFCANIFPGFCSVAGLYNAVHGAFATFAGAPMYREYATGSH